MAELTTSLVLQEQRFESKTYKLSNEKIEGFVDGLEALKQAIYKVFGDQSIRVSYIQFWLWDCMERADR